MTKCDKGECSWVWVDKVSDVYVPAVDTPDATPQAREDGYVDIQIWVCTTCAEVEARVS